MNYCAYEISKVRILQGQNGMFTYTQAYNLCSADSALQLNLGDA